MHGWGIHGGIGIWLAVRTHPLSTEIVRKSIRAAHATVARLLGARAVELSEVDRQLAQFPMDREIVFYCSCPNEASAASAAKVLMDMGYTRVRPLLGGIDAWFED